MANGSQPVPRPMAPAAAVAASAMDAHAVSCASELFLLQGIASVKMTDIAEAAGVGVATLYRHFSTKASLAMAAATLMWEHLLEVYDELVQSEAYQQLDGASKLEVLLVTYCDQYIYQPGFASFLDELDRMVLAGAVTEGEVAAYAQMLGAAYPHYEAAYRQGRADGSIVREVDFALFYRTVAHALMSVACKLSRGEVLPSDDFSTAQEELACITDMAVRSLRIKG